MKLNLYSCDLCGKEHRRADIILVKILKNDELVKWYEHLCSDCEHKIGELFLDIKEKAKDIIGG